MQFLSLKKDILIYKQTGCKKMTAYFLIWKGQKCVIVIDSGLTIVKMKQPENFGLKNKTCWTWIGTCKIFWIKRIWIQTEAYYVHSASLICLRIDQSNYNGVVSGK